MTSDNVNYIKKFYGQLQGDFAAEYKESIISDTESLLNPFITSFAERGNNDNLKNYFIDCVAEKRVMDFAHGITTCLENGKELELDEVTIDISDEIKNRDITIMIDFGDNDFGLNIELAAKEYVKLYRELSYRVNTYSNIKAENMLQTYIDRLNNIERLEFIVGVINRAYCAKYIETMISDFMYSKNSEMEFVEEYISAAKRNLGYLGLDDINQYKIGTYEEIEKYVMETYKEQQDENGGKSLKTCWLNGEVLFISIKDGQIKTWVQ